LTKAKRIPLRDVIAFIPTLIYLAMLVTAQILMSGVDRHAYICNVVQGQSIQIDSTLAYDWMVMIGNRIYKIFIPIQAIIVMIYCEFRINIYFSKVSSQHITNVSSHITRIRWLHIMTMLMAASCLLISIIPSYELAKEMWIVGPVLLLEVLFVSLSVAHANKVDDPVPVQVEVVHDNRPQAFVPNVSNVPNIPNVIRQPEKVAPARYEAAPSLISRIDAAMENEKLYLSQDLSLITMAEKIGTNRTYISKAIKDAKGCNFSDYVNRYRLDYAIYLLKKTPKNDIIIQNIAVQCGCGSIQTFYRYFKLFFNETPTQWIEKNK